jgi:hypothetical protein
MLYRRSIPVLGEFLFMQRPRTRTPSRMTACKVRTLGKRGHKRIIDNCLRTGVFYIRRYDYEN